MSAAAEKGSRPSELPYERTDTAPEVTAASEAVKQSGQGGRSKVELPELRAAYAWYETKSARETSDRPPCRLGSGLCRSDVLDLRSTHEAHPADVTDVRKLSTVEESLHLRRSQLQDSCCRAGSDPVRVSVVQVASPGIRLCSNRFRLPGRNRAAMEQL